MRAAVLRKRKTLKTFWSEAAVARVGDAVPQIQHRLLREVRDLAARTSEFFLHVVALDELESERILLCRGAEEDDGWIVIVQLGEFRDLEAEPDEQPEFLSVTPSAPVPLKGAANERFTEFGEMAH